MPLGDCREAARECNGWQSGQIARLDDAAESAGNVGRCIERLVNRRGRPGTARSHQRVHACEQIAEGFLNQRADSHRFQIVFGGHVQAGLKPGDLRRVGELVHLAAGDQRFENRCLLRRPEWSTGGAVGKLRQLRLDQRRRRFP